MPLTVTDYGQHLTLLPVRAFALILTPTI